MSAEAYTVALDPETGASFKAFLFKNVRNAEQVRSNIVSGAWQCAAVRAALVRHPLQLAAAANCAALASRRGTRRTRSVYTEILYNLSLSKNISQSLSEFGAGADRELLLCFLLTNGDDASGDIVPQVDGELCHITELQNISDMTQLKRVYKINGDEEDLVELIVSKMVTKGIVSH